MKKVYAVYTDDYEGISIHSIFMQKEDAEKFCQQVRDYYKDPDVDVDEWTVLEEGESPPEIVLNGVHWEEGELK